MRYSLDVTPATGYAEALLRAPEIVRTEMGSGMEQAAALYVREVKEGTPIGVTGLLRQSIITERRDEGNDIAAAAFSPLNYAAAVELGTKPHYPPIEPLEDWVRKKLDVSDEDQVHQIARRIQRKIGRKGTKAQNMFGEALGRLTPQLVEISRQAWSRVIDRLNRGR